MQLVGRDGELSILEETISRTGSAILVGESGVGKSATADVVLARARRREWAADRVVGTVAARSLMLGAVARLLPRTDPSDVSRLLAATVSSVRERTRARPLLLLVDDAQLLDPASATLIHHLVLDGAAKTLIVVRAGEPCPDPIVALWKDGHATRVELAPLDREASAELLRRLLDGAASPMLTEELWRLSQGNPLALRELVAGAVQAGVLEEADGMWLLRGRLPTPGRLVDAIDVRLRALDPDDRRAIELVAVGEPLDLPTARAAIDPERLERLERHGLLSIDGSTGLVQAGHPLYGEVLRVAMPTTRRANLASVLAQAVAQVDEPDPGDARAAATLILEAGGVPSPDLARQAARAALAAFDIERAEQLARYAADAHPVEGNVLLGRALRLQMRLEEAEAALGLAASAARSDEQSAEVALIRARIHVWSKNDLTTARQLLTTARSQIRDPAWKATLEAEIALASARFGVMSDARRFADEALQRPRIGKRTELAALVVKTLSQMLALDNHRLEDAYQRGLQLADELRTVEPLAAQQLRMAWAGVLLYTDPREAHELADSGSHERTPVRGAWRMISAIASITVGDPRRAVVEANEAEIALAETDPFGNAAMTRAIHAVARLQSGKVSAGQVDPVALLDADLQDEPRARVWADRARVWHAVHQRDLARAAEIAIGRGTTATESGYVVWGCDLLHDAVRLGAGERAVQPLQAVAEGSGFPVAELMAQHAQAQATADVGLLTNVASGFREVGLPVHAAEAEAQIANIQKARGDTRAARTAARAQMLAMAFTGEPTPALSGLDGLGLSQRQLELAQLAAAGCSNREIADQLVLSLRTVENHLSRTYRSLHISGRAELRELLG